MLKIKLFIIYHQIIRYFYNLSMDYEYRYGCGFGFKYGHIKRQNFEILGKDTRTYRIGYGCRYEYMTQKKYHATQQSSQTTLHTSTHSNDSLSNIYPANIIQSQISIFTANKCFLFKFCQQNNYIPQNDEVLSLCYTEINLYH